MRENQKTGRGEGTPFLGRVCPSLAAIGLRVRKTKNPEDLAVLRVEQETSSLAASAPVRAATVMAITPFLPTIAAMVITTVVAIVVMPFVARGDGYDRAARRDRAIHDDRFATRHGLAHHDRRWWARRRVNHDRAWGVEDWHGQPKIEADGNSCLGGAGQSKGGYHCYQTEQMCCFHGRSDGAVRNIFDSRSLIKTEDY